MEPKTITKLSEPDAKLKESQLGPLHWLPVTWQWQRFMQNLHVLTCLNIRYVLTRLLSFDDFFVYNLLLHEAIFYI